MVKKLIHINLESDIIETSDQLKNITLTDDNLAFFRLHCGSKNSWETFVYQMGLVKIRQAFGLFKKIVEEDDDDKEAVKQHGKIQDRGKVS